MNIFESRNLNADEKSIIKATIQDTIECLQQIKDLQEHMKEHLKEVCDRMNEKVEDKDLHIKPSLITKMAKAKMKEDLHEQKEALSEVEQGLETVYGV